MLEQAFVSGLWAEEGRLRARSELRRERPHGLVSPTSRKEVIVMQMRCTQTGQIRVEVAPGPTRLKRWISFTAYGRVHALVVDARDVIGEVIRWALTR